MARPSLDKNYLRRRRVFDYFRSLGARAVDFAEYSDLPKDIAGKVECSDLIYFTGGQASILVERIRNKDMDGVLRNYGGVIVGRSAGALAFCRRFVVTDRNKRSTKIVGGLGHMDLCVKVHYKPSKDNVLRRLSKQEKIYAVPQSAALVYDNGFLSFMGEVYLFENGEKQVLNGH